MTLRSLRWAETDLKVRQNPWGCQHAHLSLRSSAIFVLSKQILAARLDINTLDSLGNFNVKKEEIMAHLFYFLEFYLKFLLSCERLEFH